MHLIKHRIPEAYYDQVTRAMETMMLSDLSNVVSLLDRLVDDTAQTDKTTAAFCCMVVAEMRLMEADEVSFDADLLARFREFAADIVERVAQSPERQ